MLFLLGTHIKHRYTCSFVFWPSCSLPWTLGVKYRISIFSADSITSSGILLLGASLATSGKQCSSVFTLVLQRSCGEIEFEALGSLVARGRAGSWLLLFLENRFRLSPSPSVFLDSPLPLSLTLLYHLYSWYPEPFGISLPGNSRLPGCWGRLVGMGQGLSSERLPLFYPPPQNWPYMGPFLYAFVPVSSVLAVSVCVCGCVFDTSFLGSITAYFQINKEEIALDQEKRN